MVSTSTRRLPTTSMLFTVSTAKAGDGTSKAASVVSTGTANMIRAANKPPRTCIPNFMRDAPSSFRCRIAPHEPAGDSHCCLACNQFCRGGKRFKTARFQFHSKTLPLGNVIKKPLSRSRQMQDVVIGRKHHQHQHKSKPDSEAHLLGAFGEQTTANSFHPIEQKVTAIEQRHRKQVQQPDRNGKHRTELDHEVKSQAGSLPRELSDTKNSPNITRVARSDKQQTHESERA